MHPVKMHLTTVTMEENIGGKGLDRHFIVAPFDRTETLIHIFHYLFLKLTLRLGTIDFIELYIFKL